MSNGDKNNMTPNTKTPIARAIAAIALCFIGIFLSVQLKLSYVIGEASFTTFVCLLVFASLVVAFSDRLESFTISLTGIDVKLAQIESARAEVEQREKSVRRIALALAEITMFKTAFQYRMLGDGDMERQAAWHKSKIQNLLSEISASKEEKEVVFGFFNKIKDLDNLSASGATESERKRAWGAIEERMEKEAK